MISRRDVFHGLLASPLLLARVDAEVPPDVVRFRPDAASAYAVGSAALGALPGRVAERMASAAGRPMPSRP